MIEIIFTIYGVIGIIICRLIIKSHEDAAMNDVRANTRLFKSNSYEALALIVVFGLLWPLTIIVYIIRKIKI